MTQAIPGKYRHYKGKFYEVIDTAIHSETRERMVVYRALYESKDFGKDQLWVRPEKMFGEKVMIDGKEKPRFEFVSFMQMRLENSSVFINAANHARTTVI